MLIEILSEDKSGAVVVERLAERIVANEGLDVQVNVHPHRGCGSLPKDLTAKPPKFANSLLDLLPSELRAYNKIYAGKDLILIIALDSDDKDPQALRQEIYTVASKFAPDIRSIVGAKARKDIKAGEQLKKSDFCIVAKGDPVYIEATNGALTIKTTGIAMQEGRLNENIQVKNSKSKKIIEATVTGPGQVRVIF